MTVKANEDQAAAKDFFSAYFHEDWACDAKNTAEVVSTYLRRERNVEELTSIARAIEALVERELSDQLLERAIVNELGCYYLPSAERRSPREWLEEIAARLRQKATLLESEVR